MRNIETGKTNSYHLTKLWKVSWKTHLHEYFHSAKILQFSNNNQNTNNIS